MFRNRVREYILARHETRSRLCNVNEEHQQSWDRRRYCPPPQNSSPRHQEDFHGSVFRTCLAISEDWKKEGRKEGKEEGTIFCV